MLTTRNFSAFWLKSSVKCLPRCLTFIVRYQWLLTVVVGQEMFPPKDTSMSSSLRLVNITFMVEEWTLFYGTEDMSMFWILKGDIYPWLFGWPKHMWPYMAEGVWTQTHREKDRRGESYTKVEMKIGLIYHRPRNPCSHQKLQRQRADSPLEPPKGAQPGWLL